MHNVFVAASYVFRACTNLKDSIGLYFLCFADMIVIHWLWYAAVT
jgi:hypothetical protein